MKRAASTTRPTSGQALARLEVAGLKNHSQRTAVIVAFFSGDKHVTAEDLALELRDFFAKGKGTLAPIDPPRVLVVSGLYRFTRNPMYNGVLALILGEGWLTVEQVREAIA